MSVKVSKSPAVVVKPSEPVRNERIKLSSFDQPLVNVPSTSFFVFEHPIHEPAAETIKRALSHALVTYYPVSGRIVPAGGAEEDDDDGFYIGCTGEGVVFVSASADCALNEVKLIDVVQQSSPDHGGGAMAMKTTLLHELAVYYDPAEGCGGPAHPLLLMQVTQFSCGGFVLGVTWNHALADGAGMAQFIQAVGELARGQSSAPSVVPVRKADSLPRLPPGLLAKKKRMLSFEPMDNVGHEITVPFGLINRIKAGYSSSGRQPPCTTFEAAVAVLWQCRTRAIMGDHPEAPATLVFAANLRRFVGASEGYYGNCLTGQTVVATSGAVANGDVMDLITMIKRVKDQNLTS